MFSKIFKTLIILSAFLCANAFADYYFNKGRHALVFTSDMLVTINPQSGSGNISGLGYYVNDDPTFYALSESDLDKALKFSSGDEVRFVNKKNSHAEIKMTLWKEDKTNPDNNVYKIGGAGNGGIQVKIIARPYQPSGQPLPALATTFAFGLIGLWLFARKQKHIFRK